MLFRSDPTIKPRWLETISLGATVLRGLGRLKEFNIQSWVNDKYVKQAFKERGLDYEKQLASFANYEVSGKDPLCSTPITKPRDGGEIWVEGGDIVPFSSQGCTLLGVRKFTGEGKKSARCTSMTAASVSRCLPTRPTTPSATRQGRAPRPFPFC